MIFFLPENLLVEELFIGKGLVSYGALVVMALTHVMMLDYVLLDLRTSLFENRMEILKERAHQIGRRLWRSFNPTIAWKQYLKEGNFFELGFNKLGIRTNGISRPL